MRDGSVRNKRGDVYLPGVVVNYELALRRRILPTLGHRKLDDVTLGDLLTLQERMLRDGVKDGTLRNSFIPLCALYQLRRSNSTYKDTVLIYRVGDPDYPRAVPWKP